jgi:hypothetical protein
MTLGAILLLFVHSHDKFGQPTRPIWSQYGISFTQSSQHVQSDGASTWPDSETQSEIQNSKSNSNLNSRSNAYSKSYSKMQTMASSMANLHAPQTLDEEMVIAVLRPFVVSKQTPRMVRALLQWVQFPPCQSTTGSDSTRPSDGPDSESDPLPAKADLVFFADQRPDNYLQLETLLIGTLDDQSRRCFRDIVFWYAEIPDHVNRYPYGPDLMFALATQELAFPVSKYYSTFLMEPDVRPIRANWLHRLVLLSDASVEEWWMRGSPFVTDDQVINIADRHHLVHGFHINGNGMYRTGSARARRFFRNFMSWYYSPHSTWTVPAYDQNILWYLTENFKFLRHYAHLYRYSSFIRNKWSCEWSLQSAYKADLDRETFFVHHGSNPSDAVDRAAQYGSLAYFSTSDIDMLLQEIRKKLIKASVTHSLPIDKQQRLWTMAELINARIPPSRDIFPAQSTESSRRITANPTDPNLVDLYRRAVLRYK